MKGPAADPGTAPPKVPRLWRVVLAVSLAANLAFVGLAVGSGMKHRRDMTGNEVRELRFGPFSESFDKADRAALSDAFRKEMPDFRSDRAALRGELAAVLPILRAEPFDRGALDRAVDQLGQRAAARLTKGQALIVDHIAAMTPEARAAFADRLERDLSRRRGGGKP